MSTQLEVRNASLQTIADILKDQQAAKFDVVVPLANTRSRGGLIVVKGTSVFGDDAKYLPTAIADGHIAERLGIPVRYLRWMRENRPDLYDANYNALVTGEHVLDNGTNNHNARQADPDTRNVMLRTFQGGDLSETGVLRAVMSDKYDRVDNLDVLLATLEGVRATGTHIEVTGADLSESRMTVKIVAPEIFANSPELLGDYRNPFGGQGVYDHSDGVAVHWGKGNLPQKWQDRYGVNSDGVLAGLTISNSETGGGAFSIAPTLTVLKCTNGLLLTKDVLRKVHIGGRLQEGVVPWSADTQDKALALIKAQARDAVAAFLDRDFVVQALDEIKAKAGKSVTNAVEVLKVVAKAQTYTDEQQAGILDFFIKGGQTTTGGVLQAVTAYAQTVADPDEAYRLESTALEALEVAYAAA